MTEEQKLIVGNILGHLLIFLLVVFGAYIAQAFTLWDLNPYRWSEGQRGCMVIGILGFYLLRRIARAAASAWKDTSDEPE